MTFSFCPTGRPQYHKLTAKRHAADYRLKGFKDAAAIPCPHNEFDHWHVVTMADDELLEAHKAAEVRRAERRRRYEEETARRSEAMVEGFRHSRM